VSAGPKLSAALFRRLVPAAVFARGGGAVEEGLHGRLAETPAPLVGSHLIVARHPSVEAGLQLGEALVDALAERRTIERVEQGLVEALADAVGLRALRLGARVVDVLDGELERFPNALNLFWIHSGTRL
jgi:hypothetical protein